MKLEILTPKRMLFIHFLLNLVGLAIVSAAVSAGLAATALKDSPNPNFIAAINLFWYPEKRQIMIAFVITSAILFAYCLAWARHFAIRKSSPDLSVLDYWAYAMSWLLQILLLSQINSHNTESRKVSVAVLLAWTLLYFLPRLSRLIPKIELTLEGRSKFDRWTGVWENFILALCACLLVWMFWPLLTQRLRLINDNFAVPEQTLLNGVPQENIDYIREHKIYGLDPLNPNRPKSYELKLPWSPTLQEWLKDNSHRVYYDRPSETLTFLALITAKDRRMLNEIIERPEDHARLEELWNLNKQPSRIYTSEELEFVEKNWLELRWQVLNRWAIHHQNFVFGPINEYRLGKHPSQINFQYGFLNTLSVYGITRILGGFSIDSYFRAITLFYPLYFIFLMIAGWYILRSRVYLCLLAMVSLASYLYLDFEKILRAPGTSPFRHFFDIAAIASMAWYYRTQKRPVLILAYLACIVQLAFNREFGLFLLAALIAVEILQIFEVGLRKRKNEILIMLLALGGSLVLLLVLRNFSNSMNSYYSTGFASFPLKKKLLSVSLIAFGMAYAAAVLPGFLDKRNRNIFLFLAVYSNGLFLYYIWGATPPHFQNFLNIYALTLIVGAQAILSRFTDSRHEKWICLFATIAVFIAILLPGFRAYEIARRNFNQVFQSHVVHQWEFPRARLDTTADPRPFQEAISAIHKYEPDSKGVYFISTLDNYLTVLSDRYSLMPFFDLAWFLLTPDDFALAKKKILNDRPQHLFVDHDILTDHSGEVVNPYLTYLGEGGMHTESVMRIKRLEVLQRFFREVSPDYEKVVEGERIDVYRRRPESSR
ncbi:MAG: hypothetical protein AB7H97_07040 [Pseudobdellovibrionaceae bacterium]